MGFYLYAAIYLEIWLALSIISIISFKYVTKRRLEHAICVTCIIVGIPVWFFWGEPWNAQRIEKNQAQAAERGDREADKKFSALCSSNEVNIDVIVPVKSKENIDITIIANRYGHMPSFLEVVTQYIPDGKPCFISSCDDERLISGHPTKIEKKDKFQLSIVDGESYSNERIRTFVITLKDPSNNTLSKTKIFRMGYYSPTANHNYQYCPAVRGQLKNLLEKTFGRDFPSAATTIQ